jgi:hypothetical protein
MDALKNDLRKTLIVATGNGTIHSISFIERILITDPTPVSAVIDDQDIIWAVRRG